MIAPISPNPAVAGRVLQEPARCPTGALSPGVQPARTVPLPDGHSPEHGHQRQRPARTGPLSDGYVPSPCCHRPCPARADPLLDGCAPKPCRCGPCPARTGSLPDGYVPEPAVAGRHLREPAHCPTVTSHNCPRWPMDQYHDTTMGEVIHIRKGWIFKVLQLPTRQ